MDIVKRAWQTLGMIMLLSLVSAPWVKADTNAYTDDRSVAVPTAWWAYANISEASVGNLVNQNGARLTDIEVNSIVNGAPRFTVRMVKNSGVYAVPGWWWYFNMSASDVAAKLNTHNARLIDLEPYDAGGGVIRFAAIMVSNTGTAARSWSYKTLASSAQLTDHINTSKHRMIDFDTYFVGGVKFYSAVFVANTGSDAKAWQWWLNQSAAGISAKLTSYGGRIVDLERQPNGTYNFIMVKNSGSNNFAWWWSYDFTSINDLLNYANQLAVRPIDIETYVNSQNQRRYLGVFIDNANSATRRIRDIYGQRFLDSNGNPTKGIFEAYLKQANSSVLISLNSSRSAETASSLKSLHLLHAMKQVDSQADLAVPFVYYDYISGTLDQRKNACPDPSKESLVNRRLDYSLEKGLDEMMRISDNRTTRGVVLKYGFAAINATADAAGMKGTQLRHNIGCAYYNLFTQKYDTSLRNDTTAADLSRIFEGVWNGSLLSGIGRTEFLESANPATGASSAMQTIINEEAAALGKSAIAGSFGALVKSYGKGGSYNTCLPNSSGDCGQQVIIRSGAGLMSLPVKSGATTTYRNYVFGRFISDVPVPCWDNSTTSFDECPAETAFENTYNKAANELFREVIRSALQTW